MTLWSIGLIALGGGVGALVRFALGQLSGQIPWGVLLANTLGSFIAGLAMAGSIDLAWIVVGLAGGISTFSTFAAQTHQLLLGGKIAAAMQYLALTALLPAAALLTGSILL
jgi:fluoride exporter